MKSRRLTKYVRNRIGEVRESRGLTKYRLAKLCEVDNGYLIKVERQEYCPSEDVAMKVAYELDCKLSDLFYLDFEEE